MTNPRSSPMHANELPDRRLARVFGFTIEDLHANRAGFMSRGQRWRLSPRGRDIVGRVMDLFGVRDKPKRKDSVPIAQTCGTLSLQVEIREVPTFQRVEVLPLHSVTVEDLPPQTFRITPEQYRTLSQGLPYRVYYEPDSRRILSLERAIDGC